MALVMNIGQAKHLFRRAEEEVQEANKLFPRFPQGFVHASLAGSIVKVGFLTD